jgi:hypothetical protein
MLHPPVGRLSLEQDELTFTRSGFIFQKISGVYEPVDDST